MFLWRTVENYRLIITKYPPYLFDWAINTPGYRKTPKNTGMWKKIEPAHEIMVLITQATSEGSGEPAHPRSCARAFTVHTDEVWK